MKAKKCTKKRDARAQLFLCLFNPLPFLWYHCRCRRGILNSLSTHAIRNLSSTTERLIFPTLFLPYFPGWWMLPKARGLRFPAFPDELSWSLVPLKHHYPSLLTLTNFLVEYFQYYCSVDLLIFSWFLYLVQSIKLNFQDVLVLAKKTLWLEDSPQFWRHISQNQPLPKRERIQSLQGEFHYREVWLQVTAVTISGFVRDDHLHCRTMEEKDGLLFCSWVHSCTGES